MRSAPQGRTTEGGTMTGFTLRSAAEVRAKIARYLTDAAEIGSDHLAADISNVLFNTDLHVAEASAMAITEGGDTFVAELSTLHADHEAGGISDDRLAFLVAMLLHRSGS